MYRKQQNTKVPFAYDYNWKDRRKDIFYNVHYGKIPVLHSLSGVRFDKHVLLDEVQDASFDDTMVMKTY